MVSLKHQVHDAYSGELAFCLPALLAPLSLVHRTAFGPREPQRVMPDLYFFVAHYCTRSGCGVILSKLSNHRVYLKAVQSVIESNAVLRCR